MKKDTKKSKNWDKGLMASFGNSVFNLRSCTDLHDNSKVAIKKVTNIFEKPILAKRALREIRLLRHLNGHENVELG